METRRYAYTYAEIDLETGMCIGVVTRTREVDTVANPDYIPIPTYNEEYIMKYYNRENGKWYVDAAFTTEWIPE